MGSRATLERVVPSELDSSDIATAEIYRLHIQRYEFASKFVHSGRVLDCACGAGYGSEMVAGAGDRTQLVIGVDIDPAAVEHAKANHGADRVEFLCADAIDFQSEQFDTIISFETIEHVPDPESVIDNFTRLLKPGGTLIASVPITPSADVNLFHLRDFTEASFRRMFEKRGYTFVESFLQRQPYRPFKIVAEKGGREGMRQNLISYYLTHPRAAAKRFYSTAVDGFCNKYLACAWRR
jgi:SAM-dependent methyltransferase